MLNYGTGPLIRGPLASTAAGAGNPAAGPAQLPFHNQIPNLAAAMQARGAPVYNPNQQVGGGSYTPIESTMKQIQSTLGSMPPAYVSNAGPTGVDPAIVGTGTLPAPVPLQSATPAVPSPAPLARPMGGGVPLTRKLY